MFGTVIFLSPTEQKHVFKKENCDHGEIFSNNVAHNDFCLHFLSSYANILLYEAATN